jgi:ferredoxin
MLPLWENLLFPAVYNKFKDKMPKRIGILSFSPTQTTKKVCQAVAKGMGAKDPKIMDMTRPALRRAIVAEPDKVMADVDHLIVGAPVYFGRLPAQAAGCIGSIKGSGKGDTAIVVYCNRDYVVALRRLVELLQKNSFTVMAAGAFIGQHSYSAIVPVAMGRPDKADLEKACALGMGISSAARGLALEDIPTQIDFFSRSDKSKPLKPVFISGLCIQCGICADGCPMGILSPETGSYLSGAAEERCSGCMACAFHCPQKARIVKGNAIMRLVMKFILKKAARERREPLMLLP